MPSCGTRLIASERADEPLVSHWPDAQAEDLLEAAAHEYRESIADLCRRTGLLWTETMGREVAAEAASIAGLAPGWNIARQREETVRYQHYIEHVHRMTTA